MILLKMNYCENNFQINVNSTLVMAAYSRTHKIMNFTVEDTYIALRPPYRNP